MAGAVHHAQQVARPFGAEHVKITAHYIAGPPQHKLLRAEQLRVNALPGNTTPERDQPLMPAAPTALPDEAQ